MKERIERAKNFVKEHKKGFLVGAGVALVGGVVFIVAKKKINLNKCVENTTVLMDLEKPSLDVGVVDDLWQDDFGKVALVNEFTVADMGAIGQELLKIDGVTNETEVSGMLGLLDK